MLEKFVSQHEVQPRQRRMLRKKKMNKQRNLSNKIHEKKH